MIFAIAVFAPLFGSLIAGLFGPWLKDQGAQFVSILGMLIAAVCGVISGVHLLSGAGHPTTIAIAEWLHVGGFQVDWALRYDSLSAVMVLMVTVVATLIHIYSIGYMHGDRSVPRFFSYLSLFTFAMLMLVTANDLVQLFFGWEGVGLVSYLLIGFWYEKPSANAAAIKAFVMNRVGDLGFALGIGLVFFLFGSVRFPDIFAAVSAQSHAVYHLFGTDLHALDVIGILLFIGAMGKSAQIGLHPWLADAMEGPTPVSALIHAATMVTAGVFLMVRMSPLLEYAPVALAVVGVIGGTTALFAATIGCVQTDIKRIIAYSTCSQLGYMFVAVSVGAYQASIFHLITHACFKALLFLTAGSVIHAMSGEQDIRKMGGLAKLIPYTYVMMWIGSLALAGIPPLSGYFSKDAIVNAAFMGHGGGYAWFCVAAAAFLTAFYSGRLLLLTFHGKPRGDDHVMSHVHESPLVMTGPLFLLALGAIFVGGVFAHDFIGADQAKFWNGAISAINHPSILLDIDKTPFLIEILPTVLAVLGFVLSYVMYVAKPELPAMLATRFAPIYRLLLNKYYFDELYDVIFVKPYHAIARAIWHVGDEDIIDGIPRGGAGLARFSAGGVGRLQSGSLAQYAFVMLIGLVVLITVFLIFR
ncbi:NADH-quinone oxidoreductase subunit L [Acidisoma silvae]|uniref:NADH-quinone oxidoreductase subunit L n=1 Tax=Acidisoma silvae TaxID=2802396 RepID=A0A964DZ31_9PROT|nr:NADH-quinone oxidoreductase subunit L [Acidisoma silvae]MCB8875821.1 NADH-quinone oxidoreductase subunit L [Acidisoma silvae]